MIGISKLVEEMEDKRMKGNEGKISSRENSSRVPKLGKNYHVKHIWTSHERLA